jgi:curved DNA-binding protein CbpA
MTYYEELGLGQDATVEQIRQAHRKLARILHPDQQTDEVLRRLAEIQMKRTLPCGDNTMPV